jgi:hypothetical protein
MFISSLVDAGTLTFARDSVLEKSETATQASAADWDRAISAATRPCRQRRLTRQRRQRRGRLFQDQPVGREARRVEQAVDQGVEPFDLPVKHRDHLLVAQVRGRLRVVWSGAAASSRSVCSQGMSGAAHLDRPRGERRTT